MQWMLLFKSTVYAPTKRIDVMSTRNTEIDSTYEKPRLAMSAVNEVRRSVAKEHQVPVANVSVDWFEFVVGDEPLAG